MELSDGGCFLNLVWNCRWTVVPRQSCWITLYISCASVTLRETVKCGRLCFLSRASVLVKKTRDKHEQTKQIKKPRDDHHSRKTNVFITTLYGRIYDLKLSGTTLLRWSLCKSSWSAERRAKKHRQHKIELTSIQPFLSYKVTQHKTLLSFNYF